MVGAPGRVTYAPVEGFELSHGLMSMKYLSLWQKMTLRHIYIPVLQCFQCTSNTIKDILLQRISFLLAPNQSVESQNVC